MIPHTLWITAFACWVQVLTADSASCFFLAMSVAELFLCSSSSLRGTETHKADVNNHLLGITVEALCDDRKCERNPSSNTHNGNSAFLSKSGVWVILSNYFEKTSTVAFSLTSDGVWTAPNKDLYFLLLRQSGILTALSVLVCMG